MNKEKKFFEEHSEGQPLYSMSHGGQFQALSSNLIEHDMKTYIKLSSSFFSSDINGRKEMLGKQDFCTSDSCGRRLYVWKVQLNSGILWIVSGGNGRGTSYEWYSEEDKYDDLYREILDYLFNLYGIDIDT